MAKKIKISDILNGGSNLEKRYVPNFEDLKEVVKELKKKKLKIVLTQGVYDLIHQGHAAYLERAKSLGDVLIVGVDSDALTKKRKGPSRPIVPEEERLKMLVHLRHVDIVTLKGVDQGIGDLIRLVCPDVLVVSESTTDFTNQMAKEYEGVCKKIVSLPPQATTSTSARVRNLTIDGAEQLAKEIGRITQEFLDKIRNS
jgi:D-beta-D-heptose 7-phosphate kinase/D-beta-D-heptose 1-phosphate adenosyltransferase